MVVNVFAEGGILGGNDDASIIAHLSPEPLKACDRELQAFCDKVNSRQMGN